MNHLRRFILFVAVTLSCLVILHVIRSFGTLQQQQQQSDETFSSKEEDEEAVNATTTTTTTTNPNVTPQHLRWWRQWQKQARAGLARTLGEHKVFDKWGFTNTTSVMQRGFPVSWDPCTVKDILLNKDISSLLQDQPPNITVVLMGGSLTARSATHCKAPGDTSVSAGRYSNLWQYYSNQDSIISTRRNSDDGNNGTRSQISQSSLPLKVINMGQGATRTGWSVMHLDDLVDPFEADILIWDYSLNDNWGRTWDTTAKTLDIFGSAPWVLDAWFARVKYLYETIGQGKKPPPIILVFFWENAVANNSTQILGGGLDTPYNGAPQEYVHDYTLPSAGKIVQKYKQELGWNIQVVTIGGALDPHREYIAQESHWRQVWDDGVHPACPTNNLAARMLQYALYQDIAECSNQQNESESHNMAANQPSFDNKHLINTTDDKMKVLFEKLQDPNTKIASHTLFVPTLTSLAEAASGTKKSPSLRVTPQIVSRTTQPLNNTNTSVSTHKMGWADPKRQDRKYSYDLPYCDGPEKEVLMLELEYDNNRYPSPDFEWIGIGMDPSPTLVRLTLNHDIEIPMRSLVTDLTEFSRMWLQVPFWIRLSDYLTATTDDNSAGGLTLQICQTREEPPVDFYEIVAVMK